MLQTKTGRIAELNNQKNNLDLELKTKIRSINLIALQLRNIGTDLQSDPFKNKTAQFKAEQKAKTEIESQIVLCEKTTAIELSNIKKYLIGIAKIYCLEHIPNETDAIHIMEQMLQDILNENRPS